MTENDNYDRSLTPAELDEMLKRYNIGKKPLARLLGWGETAIINIKPADGVLPDSDYVRLLKKLAGDPKAYAGLLLANKDKITEIAYNKSLDTMKGFFELSDVSEAAHYIWEHIPEAERSILRLESILVWSQIYSLSFLEEPIFGDEYELSGTGMPPYPVIWERIRKYGCIRPAGLYPRDNTCEPKDEEKNVLDSVAGVLGWYGEKALEALAIAEQKKLYKLAVAEGTGNITAPCEEIENPQTLNEKAGIVKTMKIDNRLLKKYAARVLNRSKVTDSESFERFLHTRIITAMNNSDKKIGGALVTLDMMRRNGKRKP